MCPLTYKIVVYELFGEHKLEFPSFQLKESQIYVQYSILMLFISEYNGMINNRYYFPFSLTLAASQASTHSLNTSMGSERKLIFAWKSSKHFVHCTRPVFLSLSIFTSQDFSWLQNGQSKIWSKTSIFRLGGAERFDFRLPIFLWYFGPDIYNNFNRK